MIDIQIWLQSPVSSLHGIISQREAYRIHQTTLRYKLQIQMATDSTLGLTYCLVSSYASGCIHVESRGSCSSDFFLLFIDGPAVVLARFLFNGFTSTSSSLKNDWFKSLLNYRICKYLLNILKCTCNRKIILKHKFITAHT